jgi:hypothetical protein
MIVINAIRLRKVYLWPGFGLFKAFNGTKMGPISKIELKIPIFITQTRPLSTEKDANGCGKGTKARTQNPLVFGRT